MCRNYFDPKALDYEKAKKMKAVDALDTAFKVAEATFGVPRLLEPSDLVGGQVDDKSVITCASPARACSMPRLSTPVACAAHAGTLYQKTSMHLALMDYCDAYN